MNYVIGNGVSAYVFAFYHRDFKIITHKPKRNLPFVFIQSNVYSEKLLQDLGLSAVENKSVKVSPADYSAEEVKESKGIKANVSYEGTDRVANIGRDMVLKVLDITESALCSEMEEKIEHRIIRDSVTKITDKNIYLSSGEALPYEELVYADSFFKFHELYHYWDYGKNITFGDLVMVDAPYREDAGSFIEYYKQGVYTKYVNNSITKTAAKEVRKGEVLPEKAIVVPKARMSGHIAPPPPKIVFIGRSATANPHWRIEDSIFVAQYGYDLHKMLTEQNRFDYCLQTINESSMRERIPKLILHAHSELTEMLRETNWKMNISRHKGIVPKATSILEEGVDVLKLIFAIFLNFQYTPREISEMFYSKSSKIWEKLLSDFYGGV